MHVIPPADVGSVLSHHSSSYRHIFPSWSSQVVLQIHSFPLHNSCSEGPNILQNKNETKESHSETISILSNPKDQEPKQPKLAQLLPAERGSSAALTD